MKSWIVASMLGAALLLPLTGAEDAVMKGGKSPDGKQEVRIAPDKEFNYNVRVQSTVKGAKKAATLPEVGGLMTFTVAQERDQAFWHESSRAVAISDSSQRRSLQAHLLGLVDGKFVPLELPGFEDNALGRVGVLYPDRANMVHVEKWEGNDLHLKYVFDAQGRFHTFSVVLEVDMDPALALPRVSMKSITKLEESLGDGP